MKNYYTFNTNNGYIALLGNDGKLLRSTLPKTTSEEAISELDAGLGEDCVEDRNAFGDLPDRLIAYYAGKQVDFSDIEIDVSAQPPFLATVQLAAQKIPYGTLVTYRELARMAGNDRAARAAGSAMARNLVPIIVPCHRVIASGGIGGFALGLEWKRTLLRLEGVDI